jgi:hypothetical protein
LPYGLKCGVGIVAIAIAVGFSLSGCSGLGSPAVHDMPAPRADTPLTPDQVKLVTDDLVSERDKLQSSTAAGAPPAPQNAALKPASATQTAGSETKP